MDDKYRGILLIILSSLGFALMNFFVKASGDLPFTEKVLFRNLVAVFVSLVMIVRKSPPVPHGRDEWMILLLRSVLGTCGLFCNFYAIDHLVLGDASMLNKLSPFFTLLFSFLFLKERISPKQALLLAGAFLGSLLIVKPSGFQNARFFPALVGFIGGVCAGGAYTCVRALGKRGVSGPVIVFAFSLVSLVACIPFAVATAVPMKGSQVALLLLAGCGATVGQFGITSAYRYAPSREISIYDYTNVVFSALLGYFLLGEKPTLLSLAGYLVIFVMALLMFLDTKGKRTEL